MMKHQARSEGFGSRMGQEAIESGLNSISISGHIHTVELKLKQTWPTKPEYFMFCVYTTVIL